MKKIRNKLVFALYALAVGVVLYGCGDIAKLSLNLVFESDETKTATQELFFVVREVTTTSTTPCDGLWGEVPLCADADGSPRPCAEYLKLVDYPNRNDVVAAPLDVEEYTIMVYSYDESLDVVCASDDDCAASESSPYCRQLASSSDLKACVSKSDGIVPIAGGCVVDEISVNSTDPTDIQIAPRP